MAFVCFRRGVVIFQLSLLVSSCIAVYANETKAPPPPRKKVVIEGVVQCKVCTRDRDNNFRLIVQLTPIPGAVVKLQCNNTNKGVVQETKTDEKGELVLKPEKVSTWGAHKCKIFLISSPRSDCMSPGTPFPEDSPWNLGFPLSAAAANSNSTSPFQLYTTASPLVFYPHWATCM